MRIDKFRIRNFKSISDSGEVTLDSGITTLLGKNESGKTNVLKALESFNTSHSYVEDDLCLHSHLSGTQTSKKEVEEHSRQQDDGIVTIWFHIEDEDKPKLEKIHPIFTKATSLKCTKYFDNSYGAMSPGLSLKGLKADSRERAEANFTEIRRLSESLRGQLNAHSKRHQPFGGSKAQYDKIIDEIISFDPETTPDIDDFFSGHFNSLRSLPEHDDPILRDVEAFIGEVESHTRAVVVAFTQEEGVISDILPLLPSLLYFTEIERLEDTVPIEEFLADGKKHATLSNLLRLCKLDIENVKDARTYRMLSEFRTASRTMTRLINQSWTQEKVDLKLAIVRDNIVISIFDNVIRNEHPPSVRSEGFQWFLAFFINFTAASQGELRNTVMLLDDPGVHLHPSGQRDFLNALEVISKTNQVVFSTHSPFMVDRDYLERVRIVTREEESGTQLKEKFYVSDFDALQPIRAAIGMTIGDSLFTTKKNLLVEGYSDELILEAMSDLCQKKEKDHIDTSKISILPTNGARKMPYFATIITKENLGLLILLDFDPQGRKTAKELTERFRIDEGKILLLNEFTKKGSDQEIEDLIDFEFYLDAVNRAYQDVLEDKTGESRINGRGLEEQSFTGIKRYFRTFEIETNKRIDKIKVAKKICEGIADYKYPNEATISRFSRLFKTVNEKLEPMEETEQT